MIRTVIVFVSSLLLAGCSYRVCYFEDCETTAQRPLDEMECPTRLSGYSFCDEGRVVACDCADGDFCHWVDYGERQGQTEGCFWECVDSGAFHSIIEQCF
jgi:hypothetical protein